MFVWFVFTVLIVTAACIDFSFQGVNPVVLNSY